MHKIYFLPFSFAIFLFNDVRISGQTPGQAGSAISANLSSGPIRLDGRLNEPAWQEAKAVAELVQQSPHPGEPTPYTTRVKILLGKDALFIGFECTDPDPGKIAIHTMQRDEVGDGDDTVTLVLDTYGDRRMGYFFQINAAGARADGLISNPEHPSLDWDGIWDARTLRSQQGWSAEIEIPSRTLSFTAGLKSWGLNLERFVARDKVTLRWVSPTLDSFVADLSRAGSLAGVEGLRQGKGLEFNPYLIGRVQDQFGVSPRSWHGTGGFDFTWRVTPQLASVLTVNTDFAETEVDARQINLTRFPLFFPEKRAFFLEGSNQFEFGLGMGDKFIPFFSRRIGLLEGQQIPLNAGVKVNGRVGRLNLAILDVETRNTSLAPGTNLFAGRASYDLTPKFRIGTLLTNGDPTGMKENTLAGFDAVWRTSEFSGDKNLLVGGYAAFSSGSNQMGNGNGWGFKFDYPNDLLDCFVTLDQFGESLNPALGFLPRPGTRQYNGGCSVKPRPARNGAFGWIRQAFFRSYFSRVDNLKGINESWQYTFTPVGIRLESGDQFALEYAPQYEFLAAPFEITDGVVIPAGSYRFGRWQTQFETSEHRAWRFETHASFGTFYSGTLTQWINEIKWTSAQGRWQLGVEAEQNFARLPQGNFVQRLWQPQFAFAWNPNIVLTSFVQYDTESENLGTNTRLRWTFRPGRDLFVVWNRGWQRLRTRPDLALIPENETFAIKLRWTFRD